MAMPTLKAAAAAAAADFLLATRTSHFSCCGLQIIHAESDLCKPYMQNLMLKTMQNLMLKTMQYLDVMICICCC
jgi:hypothetical protein